MFVRRNCKFVYMSRSSWFYVCMFFLHVYSGMYVYMSECVYVFMYLYVCKPDEREREGDNSLDGNWIASKNANTCLHDPIILYLANRFWPSALINSDIGKQNVTNENDNSFLMFWACFFENWIFYNYIATILKYIKIFYRK